MLPNYRKTVGLFQIHDRRCSGSRKPRRERQSSTERQSTQQSVEY